MPPKSKSRSKATTNPRGQLGSATERPQRALLKSRTAPNAQNQRLHRPLTRSQTKAASQLDSPVDVLPVGPVKGKLNEQQTRTVPRSKGRKANKAASPVKSVSPEKPQLKAKSQKRGQRKPPVAVNPRKSSTPPASHFRTHRQRKTNWKNTRQRLHSLRSDYFPSIEPWVDSVAPGSPEPVAKHSKHLTEARTLDNRRYRSPDTDSVSIMVVEKTPTPTEGSKAPSNISEKTFSRRLLQRNADPNPNKPTMDDLEFVKELKKKFEKPEDFKLPLKDTDELRKITEDFLEALQSRESSGAENPSGSERDVMKAFDDFREELHALLPQWNVMTITKDEFRRDKEVAQNGSEHIFQRTLMISAIDRWHLDPMFRYACEQRWSHKGSNKLPSRGERLPHSQPDMAVYFSSEMILGTEYPLGVVIENHEKLQYCFSPDNDELRWFPFLFIEAKKEDGHLPSARSRNMHHASQALYNIYLCLAQARETDRFSKVRTFSIVLTPTTLEARVHRATESKFKTVQFDYVFDDIYKAQNYSRDNLALMLRTILHDYAAKDLFKIVQETILELARRNNDPFGAVDGATTEASSFDTRLDPIHQSQNNLGLLGSDHSSSDETSQESTPQRGKRKGTVGKPRGGAKNKVRRK